MEAIFIGIGWRVSYSSRVPLPVATEIEGTFRVNGSNKRMRELQAIFETPPRVRISPSSLPPLCCRRDDILVWQVARLEEGELHDARRRECLPSIPYPLACAWPHARTRARALLFPIVAVSLKCKLRSP